MDYNGYWSNNRNFQLSRSLYSFDVSSFLHTTVEYQDIITSLQAAVKTVSSGATSRTLTDNLVYWMSWALVLTDSVTDASSRFQFNGDIPSTFNRFSRQAVLSGKVSNCAVPPTVAYNSMDGTLQVTYSYNEFTKDPSCSSITSPENLGYVQDSDGINFNLRIDMRSVISTLAVNDGVLPYDLLVAINGVGLAGSYTYRGVAYIASKKFDVRYPGSSPIICFAASTPVPASSNQPGRVCVVKIAAVLGYPFFHHKGLAGQNVSATTSYSKYAPVPCNCSSTTGRSTYCSTFDFVSGLVMFGAKDGKLRSMQQQFTSIMDMVTGTISYTPTTLPVSSPVSPPAPGAPTLASRRPTAPPTPSPTMTPSHTPSSAPSTSRQTRSGSNITSVNSLVYDAVFQALTLSNGKDAKVNTSSLSTRDQTAYKVLKSSTFTAKSYDFCSGVCYIIAVNFYDPYDQYINPHFLEVDAGSCKDSFSAPDAAWDKWRSTAFETLVETFYVCTAFESDAWINAVGITVGNLGAITPIIILLVIILGYIVQFERIESSRFTYPYDTTTRTKLLDELASYYLKLRDGTLVAHKEEEVLLNRMIQTCTTVEVR